ncbi:hypothetical protein STEG23_013099, partial [Scotinomys teguina]
DAVHNAAGFGFSGVDEDGHFCWDLLSNLNIWKIETATSFKMYLENWNIQTSTWLKCVCYERVPWYPTALTFILSALWHGVYPGYYFTFLTGVPVTLAARAVRNNYRHHFLSSKARKVAYDVVTWAATQLAVSYTAAPFVMLAVEPTISLYKSQFAKTSPHITPPSYVDSCLEDCEMRKLSSTLTFKALISLGAEQEDGYFFIYECFAFKHVCELCAISTRRSQQRTPGFLDLNLWMVASHRVGVEIQNSLKLTDLSIANPNISDNYKNPNMEGFKKYEKLVDQYVTLSYRSSTMHTALLPTMMTMD